MADQSFLDSRYFVDATVYNCPFCNRRHVEYWVYDYQAFDWTDSKKCFCYFVRCCSCGKKSMHLTYKQLSTRRVAIEGGTSRYKFTFEANEDAGEILDQVFFYSVPTSFFVLDDRIPRTLRDLLTEAEGCLKSNFLTGASACARKLVYELGALSKAPGESYDERIKALKGIHAGVDPTYFEMLLSIQQMTSSKVHENANDGWEARHLRIILATLREVLHELYVLPAQRMDRRRAVLAMKDELQPSKKGTAHSAPMPQAKASNHAPNMEPKKPQE